MTLLEDHPVATDPAHVARSATTRAPGVWRFAARLARREARRRPGRTALAALLIAVPVAAMTIGSVFARTENGDWSAQFERRFGDADIAVDPQFPVLVEANDAVEILPPGTTSTEYLWTYTPIATGDPDSAFTYLALTDIDLTDPGSDSPIEVLAGRAPVVGEILLPQSLADDVDVSIGDDVTFERPSGTWTVSGFGRVRDTYYNEAVVIPGFDRDRIAPDFDQSIVVHDLPAGTTPTVTRQLAERIGGVTQFDDPWFDSTDFTRGMAWGWVAGVLALVAVGIVVAAAFATSARRQLVTIGQLAANGATTRVLRRTLALQGTWTGLVGSIVGLGVGLASLPLITPIAEQYVLNHDASPFRFSVTDLLVIVVTATVAATVAAAVPARSASRIPVMSALAGRRPLGKLPTWLVPTGLLLLGGGLGLVAVAALGVNGSDSSSDDVWALMVILGVLGVVFGMCCATPLVVEWIGRLGRRASLSWRLALRSLARSRTRSSAVVAAIAVAVAGSVAAGAIAETAIREMADDTATPLLPADTIVFNAYHVEEPSLYVDERDAPMIDVDALPPAVLPDDLRRLIIDIVPGATFAPTFVGTTDPAPFDTRTGDGVYPDQGGPTIATPALLDVIGLSGGDRRTLERSGALVPVGRWELAHPDQPDATAFYRFSGPDGAIEFEAVRGSDAYEYDFAGWAGVLATPAYARGLGFDIVERGAVVRAPQALTVRQRDRLAEMQVGLAGAQSDAFIERGDPPRPAVDGPTSVAEQWNMNFDEPSYRGSNVAEFWITRLVILGAVVLLSLLVVAIGLSLAAAEGRDERNVLAVVGATPASMRRQAAARATVLALSGIALGIPTGFLPAWVLYSVLNTASSISTEPLRFPWLIVGALVVAVPLLVAGAAWLGSAAGLRFRPPTPARRD